MGNEAGSSVTQRWIDRLPVCGGGCRRTVIGLLWALLLLLPLHELYFAGFNVTQWDALLFTGIVAFIIGLYLAGTVRSRFEGMLERLLARGTLSIEQGSREELYRRIEAHALRWARVGGLVAAAAMLAAFALALLQTFYWPRLLLGVAEALGAYIAGNVLGRMASYGQFGWHLQREPVQVHLQPAHVDGVAGLKPVGDFYFYQAMIAAIPAIFLAVWWFLFPLWPRDYSHWEDPYLALLSIAIAVEVLAFVVPIWAFHRIMLQAKTVQFADADRLCHEINDLRRQQGEAEDGGKKAFYAERIEVKCEQYLAIENMPTWPVDLKTKRRFRLNNVFLFIPLLGDIAKRSVDWKEVLNVLKRLGS